MKLSLPFKYCLYVDIIPANLAARQVQDYYNIRFLMYKEAIALRHNTVTAGSSASQRTLVSVCHFRCH